jgi:hypothetical protein
MAIIGLLEDASSFGRISFNNVNRKGQAFPRSILPSSAAAASGSRENRPTQNCVGVVSPQRFYRAMAIA